MHTSLPAALPSDASAPRTVAAPSTMQDPATVGRASGRTQHALARAFAGEVLDRLRPEAGSGPGHGRDGGRVDPGAVARVLSSGIAGGRSAQSLLADVRAGMDAAQARLAEAGFDPARIQAAASQFAARVAGVLEGRAPSGDPVAGPGATSSLEARVHVDRKERGSLTLTTQDGDVLRIRFRHSERQSVELSSLALASGQATRVSLSSREHSRLRVEVEGSLDADELKAIQDFVGKVDALANEFFEGDIDATFGAAGALDFDAAEIAGYSLALSMSERVRADARLRTTAEAPVAPPAPQAAAPSPAAQSPSGAGQAAAGTEAGAAPASPATTSVNDARASPTAPADPGKSMQGFLRDAFKVSDAQLTVGGHRLAWSTKLQLIAEAVAVGARRGGADALTTLLDRTAAAAGVEAAPKRIAEAA